MSDKLSDYQRPRAPPVIDAWDAGEPDANAPCLFANGFTLIEEYPEAPQHPYLVLAPLMGTNGSHHFGVGLYLTPHTSRHVLRHPSEDRDVGQLVDALAQHIASARFTTDILEIKTETPLHIYVVDPAWRPVAERFVAEYGRSSSEVVYSK
ncbi:hypothetical protein HZC31_05410 [Candidatus Woesearchaeota archaeon]|nr:hypothetical protein [Candidatus Woesearchaeota archaeon]